MAKSTPRSSQKTTVASSTILRAYRFETGLFKRFEADCARHLRNPRTVLEALIHHWLAANPKQRDLIAEHYQQVERAGGKPSHDHE